MDKTNTSQLAEHDRSRILTHEINAELMHQYLAQALLLDLITEEQFNQHAADFKWVHSE